MGEGEIVDGFSIGEVEEITGVKAHILRYWEEIIPTFAPVKNIGGRRIYLNSDVQIIFRLKYLINEKNFTIKGARNQIIAEASLSGSSESAIPTLHHIRSDLLDLYSMVRSHRKGKLP